MIKIYRQSPDSKKFIVESTDEKTGKSYYEFIDITRSSITDPEELTKSNRFVCTDANEIKSDDPDFEIVEKIFLNN